MTVQIERIDSYNDPRFSPVVLHQHGAFLVNGLPWEVEIVSDSEAVVYGSPAELAPSVIESFRFYAEHIWRFYDGAGVLLEQFLPVELFPVSINALQPSQFYLDEEKLAAVCTFVRTPQDVIIPLAKTDEGLLVLDGHTRLAVAMALGMESVMGYFAEPGEYLEGTRALAREAKKRGVYSVKDLKPLAHSQYVLRWHRFCDNYFGKDT